MAIPRSNQEVSELRSSCDKLKIMEEKQYDILETRHGRFLTTFSKKYLARKPWKPDNPNYIKSSIPGTIVQICVKEGQQVKTGDILVVFKAMKMNNNVRAPKDGRVCKIYVKEGDNVPSFAIMMELE